MTTKQHSDLNPIAFLQTFITQSVKVAAQKGCSECDGHFNHIELIGLTASSCFENAARQQLGLSGKLTTENYADVIVCLKNRIGGAFARSSSPPGVVRVESDRCPFGDRVKEAPELCRMTSSVFGGIAARNFGYAKVQLEKRLAVNDDRCVISVYTDPVLAESAKGDEYRSQQDTLITGTGKTEVSVRVSEKMDQVWCMINEQVREKPRSPRPTVIAESRAMQAALEAVEIVAPTSASVFISGETGVGKEIISRAIHAVSNRSDKQFVAVNCGAVPQELIESALFGHEKGAFTGAYNVHNGFFERAEHGTLFLDEIDSLPLPAQAKLLRVLQDGEFERVGGHQMLHADVRIIAASNRDIQQLVATEQFRSDLFYRLNVVPIHIPPLRERPEDASKLIDLMLNRLADRYQQPRRVLGEAARAKIFRYHWPGNVRELENVLERAYLFAKGPVIENIDVAVQDGESVGASHTETDLRAHKQRAAQEVETRMLKDALFRHEGNVSAVARQFGITRRAVHKKIKNCGIDCGVYRQRGQRPNYQ